MDHHEDIIIFIDANETTQNTKEENTPSITTLINNLGLISLASILPEKQKSREYGRLVDLCLITPSILSSAHAFGYLPYNKITTTDHRPQTLFFRLTNSRAICSHS